MVNACLVSDCLRGVKRVVWIKNLCFDTMDTIRELVVYGKCTFGLPREEMWNGLGLE